MSWVAAGSGLAASLFAESVANLSAEASIYFLYVGIGAMLVMLTYAGFLRANVDAAAMRAFRSSLGVGPDEVGFWGRNGSGIFLIALMVVVVAAALADAARTLPFKAMDLLWALLGIMLLAAVVFRAYKEIRKRIR